MKLVYKYLLNQFLSTYLSIFFVLFGIVSMIFFLRVANISSSIEVSFLDLFMLYAFMLPRVLLFTMPVAFFVALVLCLFRLSRENESIVFFTLGFEPWKMARFFLKIAFLLSTLMLVLALVMIPIVFQLQDNFVDYKKTQVKFNYKTGEFGQKFLGWMIFIEEQSDDKYENIIMYHPKRTAEDKEQVIIAKEARVEKNDEGFAFVLRSGKMYNFEDGQRIFAGDFENLTVNTLFSNATQKFQSFYHYWSDLNQNKSRAKEFVMYVCISLFPLASTLFALSFGIVTYRYQKGFIYVGMLSVIGAYFGILVNFHTPPLLASLSIFLASFLASLFCFQKMIVRRY